MAANDVDEFAEEEVDVLEVKPEGGGWLHPWAGVGPGADIIHLKPRGVACAAASCAVETREAQPWGAGPGECSDAAVEP